MSISRKVIEQLIKEHRLFSCFECGKCTAVCPLCELFADLKYGSTPKGVIERALCNADLVTTDTIWYCLTCNLCTDGCPCGVKLRDFIEALRCIVIDAGHDEYGVRCRRCDKYFLPDTNWQLILESVGNRGSEPPGFLFLCPNCRKQDFADRVKRSLPGPGHSTR
jgi:L-lactate utilization protein LutB